MSFDPDKLLFCYEPIVPRVIWGEDDQRRGSDYQRRYLINYIADAMGIARPRISQDEAEARRWLRDDDSTGAERRRVINLSRRSVQMWTVDKSIEFRIGVNANIGDIFRDVDILIGPWWHPPWRDKDKFIPFETLPSRIRPAPARARKRRHKTFTLLFGTLDETAFSLPENAQPYRFSDTLDFFSEVTYRHFYKFVRETRRTHAWRVTNSRRSWQGEHTPLWNMQQILAWRGFGERFHPLLPRHRIYDAITTVSMEGRNPRTHAPENPYTEFLAEADAVFVLGTDSIMLVSDAVASGKPVYIVLTPQQMHAMQALEEKKHLFFREDAVGLDMAALKKIYNMGPKDEFDSYDGKMVFFLNLALRGKIQVFRNLAQVEEGFAPPPHREWQEKGDWLARRILRHFNLAPAARPQAVPVKHFPWEPGPA
jgi:hypothetical protein